MKIALWYETAEQDIKFNDFSLKINNHFRLRIKFQLFLFSVLKKIITLKAHLNCAHFCLYDWDFIVLSVPSWTNEICIQPLQIAHRNKLIFYSNDCAFSIHYILE